MGILLSNNQQDSVTCVAQSEIKDIKLMRINGTPVNINVTVVTSKIISIFDRFKFPF